MQAPGVMAQHLIATGAHPAPRIARICTQLDLFALGPGGADGRDRFDAGAPKDDRAHHQFCRCASKAVEIIPWHSGPQRGPWCGLRSSRPGMSHRE